MSKEMTDGIVRIVTITGICAVIGLYFTGVGERDFAETLFSAVVIYLFGAALTGGIKNDNAKG